MAAITEVDNRLWNAFMGAAGAALMSLQIDLNPVPASRPRVTRWGTFYQKTYAEYKKSAAGLLRSVTTGKPCAGPVAVLLECVVGKPKTGKLSAPRGDVDNYAKAALDVLTEAQCCWLDDDQVQTLIVSKRYATPGEAPHTNVHWFQLKGSK